MEANNLKEIPEFTLLDLSYMKQISRNDRVYERSVTKIFIQTIPENLKELDKALENQSYIDLHRIFHYMQSSLAIMGVDKTLNNCFEGDLEGIDLTKLKDNIQNITNICNKAVEEAKKYLKAIE